MLDHQAIVLSLVTIAQEVGEMMLRERASFDASKIVQKSSASDLVSYVDTKLERFLVEKLHELLPEAGFVTEEKTVPQAEDQPYVWVIDPLDGTTNFLHNYPQFCTSIGLAHHGKVVLGAIYEPSRAEAFYAWQGGGAWCNGTPIRVSERSELTNALLCCGFPSSQSGGNAKLLSVIQAISSRSRGFRRIGSAALDIAYVARGWFEGFFEHTLNSWDMAAGLIILEEAGGKITDFDGGDDVLYNGKIIATNGIIHEELREIISNIWQK